MTPCPKPQKRAKARKPLSRKTWIRKRRPRRLSRPGSDPAYLDFVRSLPCYLCSTCDGIHAHHAIHRSQGGTDKDAIPLCMRHHQQWHDHNGAFAGLNRFYRFAWSRRAIADTQGRYSERSDGNGR